MQNKLPSDWSQQVPIPEKLDDCCRPNISVIVPIYNEVATVRQVFERLRLLPGELELVLVDDGSDDGTSVIVRGFQSGPGVTVIEHTQNLGKGAALRSGFAAARGAILVIQDADLEYDPQNIERLVAPIAAGEADVVYGSRFLCGANVWLSNPQRWANLALTRLSNWATGLSLTDMETCQKAFRREVIESMAIRESGFNIEPELTAKFAAGEWRIREVAVSYQARTKVAGKKIGVRDGLWAIWCIVRYGLSERSSRTSRRRAERQL